MMGRNIDANDIKYATLGFKSGDVERDYRLWSYENSIRFIRIFLFIGVFVHLTVLPLEKMLLGAGYEWFWKIRIMLLIPACVIVYTATYRPWFFRWSQTICMTLVLVTGLSMSVGAWMYPSVETVHFARAVIMVVIFSMALLGLRFMVSFVASWVIIVSLVAVLLVVRTNANLLASELSMLIEFGIALTFIAYKQELTERYYYVSLINMRDEEMKNIEKEKERISWLENLAKFLKHEIKNSISGVVTSHQLLKKFVEKDGDGDKYLCRAVKSVGIISKLLDSVTSATGVEAAFYSDKKYNVSVNDLVGEQVDAYRQIYSDIEIVFNTDGVVMLVHGSEERIVQMLDNLVCNAVESNYDDNAIVISLFHENDRCVLRVLNHGAPLPEDHESLYKLFYSGKRDSRHGGNHGIGLYVVKMIAEGYGGAVFVRALSKLGGAEFVVELPVAAAPH